MRTMPTLVSCGPAVIGRCELTDAGQEPVRPLICLLSPEWVVWGRMIVSCGNRVSRGRES